MSNYRRANLSGGTYFFDTARQLLREAILKTRQNHPFTIDAFVLLPNHLHCLWTLPENDHNFSTRWNLIKSTFSKSAKPYYHNTQWMNPSKQKHRETTIWQRRFWEHLIRDDHDFEKHVDYIHWNPVKHGYVQQPRDLALFHLPPLRKNGHLPN